MPGSAVIMLGAGYSAVAGLPLASRLLDADTYIASRHAKDRFEKVWQDYDSWHVDNCEAHAEEYLRELYLRNRGPFAPPFGWAVELVSAVLSSPRGTDAGPINPRYAVRLTRPLRSDVHTDFWATIVSCFDRVGVVTTNYDLCIERCLRHRRIARSSMPGFFYVGLPLPQVAKGVALPWRPAERMRTVTLDGSIPVYKIHGSLNWVLQDGRISLFQDARAAFRHGGDAAIVPPIPEKEIPVWLQPVWAEAERRLACAQFWIICGYSLPQYDKAVCQMLSRAATPGEKVLFILDPLNTKLKPRWQEVAPTAEIVCLPGLPGGTTQLNRHIRSDRDRRARSRVS
jgi:hypothetical protein